MIIPPAGAPESSRPGTANDTTGASRVLAPAAARWASLWTELDLEHAALIGRAGHVKAQLYGPRLELIPQFFDLRNGRRYISIGIKYDTGPGSHRQVGSVGFGQFLNLAFADWAIADQIWNRLQQDDGTVSFHDLSDINGNFDHATKASDRFLRDTWLQRVWELKISLEKEAKESTRAALGRITSQIRSHPNASEHLGGEGLALPSEVLGPTDQDEAMTRFRINQGMYGDHTCFIEIPVDHRVRVHGIPMAPMFRRAEELHEHLHSNWLSSIADTMSDLLAATPNEDGPALARTIESAETVRRLNSIVQMFWSMWQEPVFSANAAFEVVTDPQRRSAKYMEILIQRTLRILLKQSVEAIGVYPYANLDRFNYRGKVKALEEALRRTSKILELYGQVRTVPAFREATVERNRLVHEFQNEIRPQAEGRAGNGKPTSH